MVFTSLITDKRSSRKHETYGHSVYPDGGKRILLQQFEDLTE